MNHIPLFYHPVSYLLIDDDPLILGSITTFFKERIKLFDSPKKGLDFLENYTNELEKNSLLRGDQRNENYTCINHSPVDFNVTEIQEIKENSKRFDEIAVMIIDYQMPEMDGFSFAQACQTLPIHKILLTGKAEPKEAIDGFNKNLIDRFVQKTDPLFCELLTEYLEQLTYRYFQTKTLPLLSHLETENKLPLSDPTFVQFFNKYLKQHHIREYYLIDKHGSFLCIDDKGKPFYFVTHTDRSLNHWLEVNSDESKYLAPIKERIKIPFFGIGKESWEFNIQDWQQFFYSPNVLEGEERYYWAEIYKAA